VVLFGVEDGILLAIVLSLLQHVRHSYEPSVAVKTQTADGNWHAIAVEPGRMAAPGWWCIGSGRISSMQTLIASSPRHANWRPNLRPPCAGFVDAGAITR
jgi:MFS superfamily sulfate permease-like transporter